MQKRIIINASAIETRIALCEANALAELHVESGEEHSIVGNIYKGKVLRVLPGMQAAFVEIGLDKAAFMHVSDFWRAPGADGVEEAPAKAVSSTSSLRSPPMRRTSTPRLRPHPRPPRMRRRPQKRTAAPRTRRR